MALRVYTVSVGRFYALKQPVGYGKLPLYNCYEFNTFFSVKTCTGYVDSRFKHPIVLDNCYGDERGVSLGGGVLIGVTVVGKQHSPE